MLSISLGIFYADSEIFWFKKMTAVPTQKFKNPSNPTETGKMKYGSGTRRSGNHRNPAIDGWKSAEKK